MVLRPWNSISKDSQGRGGFQFSFKTFMVCFTAAIVITWAVREGLRGSEILFALIGAVLIVFSFFTMAALLFLIGWVPAVIAKRLGVPIEDRDPYGRNAAPPEIPNSIPTPTTEGVPVE
ncbi:hypothetical protein FF011L_22290 [Roseimaritima multifibrata]|uniref:Uncharacterized protein n=2 Tax=Roseimaritima multifibrata TaxID=1930274 RepID=A0A517MEZ9_9BACT|nr:hypothetical protein FF011L_22290 [Roseimaritima multifibrata]